MSDDGTDNCAVGVASAALHGGAWPLHGNRAYASAMSGLAPAHGSSAPPDALGGAITQASASG